LETVLKVIRLQHSSRIYVPVSLFAKFTGVERGEYYNKAHLTLTCHEGGLGIIISDEGNGVPVTVHSKKLKSGGYIRYITIPLVIHKVLGDRQYIPVEVCKGYMLLKVL